MSSPNKRAPKNQAQLDHKLNELIVKLQALLPASSSKCDQRVEVAAVIKETCSYIKSLQKEVKIAGERLSQLLAYEENNGPELDILINLLQQ